MPTPAPDEARRIAMLLEDGWDAVHLRHPGVPCNYMMSVLKSLPHDMIEKIVIHDHFMLAADFKVGALHLNSRHPAAPAWYTGAVTASCHSIEEVSGSHDRRYVTLSPVFDSISKPGYKSAFSLSQLRGLEASPVKVIALGGINHDNIHKLSSLPFSGYAVMGAIAWHEDINQFKTSFRCFSS
ncbi:MAG: thiamine phosphate synthase [Duncaniella sp.]|nr:thiamine phosphate synthase [Duncaniella sp.]